MLRTSAKTSVPDGAPPPKQLTHEEMIEERLDVIVEFLRRSERRDRMRITGSFVRNILALVPMIFFIASLWYVYAYGDVLLKKMADEAARSAAQYSQESASGFMEQLQQYLPRGSQSSLKR